jgi:2-dehydro-3-deoxy-L-rhamnonate dehydrogenase (NAD+)
MNTFFGLDGKVAFVTGGGQGIGEAICRRLAQAGAKVGVFDRHAANAQKVALSIGGHGVAGDMTSEADVETAVEDVAEHFGAIDILVNNAGITGKAGKLWELSKGDWEEVMHVNVVGSVICCKAVVHSMRERKYGRIVNIASVAGKEGNPTLGP